MKEPEKYGFRPKELLNTITDIYLHLDSKQLARAVANDEVMHIVQVVKTRLNLEWQKINASHSLLPPSDLTVRKCLTLASLS